MSITRPFARSLVVVLVALLFLGTLMPGAWKSAAARPFPLPLDLAALAHVTLFAAICSMVQLACFWKVKPWHVPALGLALALLTEGLQFFATDRHPNMAGVYQDMAGALIGWIVGRWLAASNGARPLRTTPAADSRPGRSPR